MEVKPGFKETEVGVIPQDWDILQFREVANIKTGPFGSSLHERDYVSDGTPIITVEHLSEYGVVHSNLPMVSDVDKQRLKSYILEENDIVFSRVGSVDRNSLISQREAGWLFSGRLLRVRPNGKKVFSPYLSYQLHSEPFKQRVRGVAVGQTMPSLNTRILSNINIVLPHLPEQRTIAAALSDVDALITALDKLITKKRDIKQAAMQELLTGRRRLPGFSGDWSNRKIGDCLKVRHGKSQKNVLVSDGQYPILATSGEIARTNDFLYAKPSVLIGRKGTIDSPQFIDTPFWTIDTLFYTEISESCAPMFMFYKFCMIDWMLYNEASGVPSLNASTIENIEIKCPDMKEQHAIAAVLSDMDADIVALESRHDKTKALKQGMMQELLTGRIRLVEGGAA